MKKHENVIKYSGKAFKQMLMRELKLEAGHWFECPNGHMYAIGECGGAVEESKCPDCGSVIGGRGY